MPLDPIPHVPHSVGAIVALEHGQIGGLYDQRTRTGALYMSDRVTLARTHSEVTVDELRAAIGMMSELIELMQASASPAAWKDVPPDERPAG